jgi:hypothetical protein
VEVIRADYFKLSADVDIAVDTELSFLILKDLRMDHCVAGGNG